MATTGCDVDKVSDGELPSVDVDVSGDSGKLPEYDVEGPDVDVSMEKKEVSVPDVDVDVDMKKRDIKVPDVDISLPNDE